MVQMGYKADECANIQADYLKICPIKVMKMEINTNREIADGNECSIG